MKKMRLYSLIILFFFVNALHAAEKFSEYFDKNIRSNRCITPLLARAKTRTNELSPKGKTLYKTFSTRPSFTGEKIFKTKYIDIHFTLTGKDSVPRKDVNKNTIPDYVEKIAAVFDEVYLKDSIDGYYMPPSDGKDGGSNRYDVYIYNIGLGLYGFVQPENFVGDNPKSKTINESASYTSWMGMNTDYSFDPLGFDSAIEVTIAHEFFHAIQFGYTIQNTAFFSEATAVWMEDHHYPGNGNNFQYLGDFFNRPDVSIDISDSAKYADHTYSMWIYFKYLSEHTSPDVIRQFLEATINDDEIPAIQNVLLNKYKLNFKNVMNDFFIASSVMENNSKYPGYSFKDAARYLSFLKANSSTLTYEYIFDLNAKNTYGYSSNIEGNSRLMHLSADYFKVYSKDNFHVKMKTAKPSAQLYLFAIKRNKKLHELEVVQSSLLKDTTEELYVTGTDSFDDISLMISRLDTTSKDTNSIQYSLVVDKNLVGLEDGSEEELPYISVYPNPAITDFTFEWNTDGRLTDVSIYNANGKLMLQQKNLDESGDFKTETINWAQGSYQVFATDESGNIYHTKILVIAH